MKTVLIGDIHGRTNWKRIVRRNSDAERFVFFGDYFDPYEFIPIHEQIANFEAIVEFAMDATIEVVLLLGNHDLHYYADVETCSRYDRVNSVKISKAIDEALMFMRVAYQFDNVLCTHAGVSPKWMDKHITKGWSLKNIVRRIEDLHDDNPQAFAYQDEDISGYGASPDQGPMWIRPESLISVNKKDTRISDTLVQAFGHTQVDNIEATLDSCKKYFDGKYIMVDGLEGGGYIVHEDGEFTARTVNMRYR